MKLINKYKTLIFFAIVTAFFCYPIVSRHVGVGYDLYFHLYRFEGIKEALQAHQFPVYIYPYHNFGFGYGSPMFYSDFFIFIPALFYTIGVPIAICYKGTLIFYVIVGSITSYVTLKHIFKKDNLIIYIGFLLYMFSGNRILDLFQRSALSSVIAYSFLPVLMLAFYRFFIEKNDCWFFLGMSFALILLAHLLTFVTCCVCFFILLVANCKEIILNKRFICVLKAMLLAMGVSAFFLFPFIEQRFSQSFFMDFTIPAEGKSKIMESQLSLSALIHYLPTYSEVTYGIAVVLLIPIFYVIDIYKRTKNKFTFKYYDGLFILYIFSSLLTWEKIDLSNISLLYTYQFVWRILLVTYLFVLFLLLILLSNINSIKINKIVLILIMIFNTYSYAKYTKQFKNIKNDFNITDIVTSEKTANDMHDMEYLQIMKGEYLPYTNSYDYYHASKSIVFANDEGYLFDYDRQGTTIIFNTNLDYDERVYMHLSWYKGYYYQELDSNGNVISENECFYNEYSKRVGMNVTAGAHTYKVFYKGTHIQKISVVISIITLLISIGYIARKKHLYLSKKNIT